MNRSSRFVLRALAGAAVSIILYYIFLILGVNLITSAILFVFPVGGLISGGIIGYLSETGLIADNKTCNRNHIVLLCVIGVTTIGIMTAIDYLSCYVLDSGDFNRFFNGYHISNYALDNNQIDFIEYFKLNYLSSEMSISWRGNRSNPIHMGKTGFVFVIYLLQYIGVSLLSSLLAYSVNKLPRCEKCGKYYKEIEIERYKNENSVDEVIHNFSEIINTGREFRSVNRQEKNYKYVLKANYCKDCKNGMIVVYEHTGHGRTEKTIPKAAYKLDTSHLVQLGLIEQFFSQDITPESSYNKSDHDIVDEQTAEQLRTIKQLFDEGVLTKEEFEAKKKKILDI